MSRLFRYRARDEKGNLIKGNVEADSQDYAIKTLVGEGLVLLEVREININRGLMRYPGFMRKAGTGELAIFGRQFTTMIRAGVPLLRCLEVLREQLTNRHLKEAVRRIRWDVEAGVPLWKALEKHPDLFPRLFVQMVKTGELGGQLEQVLERLTAHLEREHEIESKIRNALLYPGLVSGFALLVLFFLVSFVMPTFVSIFAGAGVELPLPTRVLLAAGTFLKDYLVWIIVTVVALGLVFRTWAVTPNGSRVVDRLVLELPLLGQVRGKLCAARFARTMGTLVESGIPILTSLEATEEVVGNKVIAEGIRRASNCIRAGENISTPLQETGVFEPMVTQMVAVGEETGTLDEMLVKVAEYYESEVSRIVDTLVSLLEPVLILVTAVLVGLVAVGSLLPMLDMIMVFG